MDPVRNGLATTVASAEDVRRMEELREEETRLIEDELDDPILNSSLASHVSQHFITNKEARQTSGMEDKLLQSLRAYNGHYDPEDLKRIAATNGSQIFMNLTATKCRHAMSWIRDIMMSANEKPWSFKPTPVVDIPEETNALIREQIEAFASDNRELKKQEKEKRDFELSQVQQQQSQGQQQQQPIPPIPKPVEAANDLKDINQMKRDIEEAFQDEVYKLAEQEVKKFEKTVEDQLVEGDWERALSEFIEDFCVFPVAIMKGPIITKKNRVAWEDGEPVVKEDFIFLNKRVSPLDIYPQPNATSINDGNLCEHLRLHREEVFNLIGTEGYNDDNLRSILERNESGAYRWLDTQIEEEKVVEEYRGNSYDANLGVFHGIHYFGTASGDMLKEWGLDSSLLNDDPTHEYQIEAILIVDTVVKVEINEDPLLRRPYYKSSFQNIPGSWWGRALPELMRDMQRMCNATARALSNNMGVASGPQIEIYTDRIADDNELEEIFPFKIWQVNSDPAGSGGRAVNFWQPSSNAAELLNVYKEFELRADEVTGVPRHIAGNEDKAGISQTATGQAILLETASKGIKDSIRHIDEGLIKPRIEYQFYWNMISDPDIKFSGDIVIVPKGSENLITQGTQEQRRNEFLQILTNPAYIEIVGIEGIADILREMSKSLGLGNNIVPSRIELKLKQAQAKISEAEAVKSQQEAESAKNQVGVQQVQMQVEQAEMASQRSAELKDKELQLKGSIEQLQSQIKAIEIEARKEIEIIKTEARLQTQQMVDSQKDRSDNKNIALSIKSNYEDKNNLE